ncbi:hypothetical protein LOTGIDRAFT_104558, partial [Lottia gigantea]
ANLGGVQTLDCKLKYPRGNPIPYIIQWKKDGLAQPIFIKYDGYPAQIPHHQYRNRLALKDEVSLEISHIQANDEGWYECNTIFIDGAEERTVNGSWIYLTVHSPPRIISSSPKLLQPRRGDDIELFCEGKGSPQPTLTWRKDSRVIKDTLRLKVEGNRVKIQNLQRDDGGVYTCTYINSVGEISQLIKLVVEGGPYIMLSPKNMTAILGQRVKFSCGAEAYPNNITYYWFKNGIDVRTLSGFEAKRIGISTDGSLLIKSVVKGDMGWFLCRPSNGIGEDEAAAFLNVTYLPKVLPMPSQLTWARGFREKIDCPVDANPPMTDTIWTRNEYIINIDNTRQLLFRNGTLVVANASAESAGSYRCTPVSLLGRGETSPPVQVFVRDPPYFTLRPPSQFRQHTGDSVSLPCKADGNPTPRVTWKRSKGEFENSNRIQINNGNLTINDLIKEDHGFYECIATNDIASVVAVTELRIMNTTPHAPYNVTVIPSLFSAKVTWEPAYDGGSPQYYVLWYVIYTCTYQWQTIQVPQESMAFTLYRLSPDTMYEFMVLSRNEHGDGMYSERVRAQTLDLVTALPTDQYGSTYRPDIQEPIGKLIVEIHCPRPSAPGNVSIAMEENEVTVSWLPPINSSVPILYYVVEFRTNGNWQKYDGVVRTSDRLSMKMSNLNRGTQYDIRVLSYGVLAYSLPSNIVSFNTTPEPFRLPDALIGGIVGGLLFLLVAVLLAVIAVIHSKRKEQKTKVSRYSKYSVIFIEK